MFAWWFAARLIFIGFNFSPVKRRCPARALEMSHPKLSSSSAGITVNAFEVEATNPQKTVVRNRTTSWPHMKFNHEYSVFVTSCVAAMTGRCFCAAIVGVEETNLPVCADYNRQNA